ncbi:hypothetical protein BLNAU_18355 [Blattamonas nauphoetae]|uniref:Protein kinase domain-containing protein n=1 Tax=Blattamonas nauphoetae TaxID=2049346 RepID=A0ABQ9X525_9EUKA|nr:hypothetical protein BLNAU_18355 [Blattamonas nauphoetae]
MKVAAQYTKWDKSRPDADLLLLVVQLVYPLKYMHTKFIHRAIRSDCIFLETAKPAVFANLQYALRYNQESGTKTSAPYVKNGLGPDTSYQPSRRIRPRETSLDNPLYDSRVDIWAIGLILHEIAYGKSIFGSAHNLQILTRINQNQFDITQYDPLHPKFHAILKRMLSTDADTRPTAASLQDPQLQPAYNFLTSVPAVPMIKTNASSILNSAIPQETFPDDLQTRQNRFVQSMARLQAAGDVTISVDSANLTESACDAIFSLPAGDIKKNMIIEYKTGTTSSNVHFSRFLQDIFTELGNKAKIGILESKTASIPLLPDETSHPLFIGGSFKTLDADLLPAYKEQAMVAILNYYTPFISLARTHLQSIVSESDLRHLSALELSQIACL